MKIRDFQDLKLGVPNLRAYLTRLNIYKNRDIIFPHEEITKDSQITRDILKNSLIVLGVTFQSINTELMVENKIFILDGHHRFRYIVDNEIDETFEVVLIDLHRVNIESHNCELNVDLDSFINKVQLEHSFNSEIVSKYFIKVNQEEYFSESFTNIYDLYQYKKELMLKGIITPIANNQDTQKTIINFTALKSFDFSVSTVFPYKSTWITPRFDS
tara:strand:- start:696 stop:1340 length:645 start_codon:yes stop_codon:yes gene_type:complete